MPTVNELHPRTGKARSQVELFRLEKEARLSVLGTEPRGGKCPTCGQTAVIFNCHAFGDPARPIVGLCKSCAIDRAGGEEKVLVRESASGLLETWRQNRRQNRRGNWR